jgi:hypothetical protein
MPCLTLSTGALQLLDNAAWQSRLVSRTTLDHSPESQPSHSQAILVGETQSWLPELKERAKKLKVNGGFEKDTDLLVYR